MLHYVYKCVHMSVLVCVCMCVCVCVCGWVGVALCCTGPGGLPPQPPVIPFAPDPPSPSPLPFARDSSGAIIPLRAGATPSPPLPRGPGSGPASDSDSDRGTRISGSLRDNPQVLLAVVLPSVIIPLVILAAVTVFVMR